MIRETASFPLGGGLDLVTPPIRRSPGTAIGGHNYEPRPEGYRRVAGFERYDGRPLASSASYGTLDFTGGTAAIAAGDTVTSATATAQVLAVMVDGGAWAAGTAAGRLVLAPLSGTITAGQALSVGGAVRAMAAADAVECGAVTDGDHRAWQALAVERTRSLIGPVPGSGPVRGVAMLHGTVYALRDDDAGTRTALYRAGDSGWQPCALGWTLGFTDGSAKFAEGQTVTGTSSGATGLIARVVTGRGAWADGDAAGRLMLSAVTGTFAHGEVLASPAGLARVDGGAAVNRLEPGGRYEFTVHGFAGAAGAVRLYGCDGINRAFEWDGAVFTPIDTGLIPDRPSHIAAHGGRLFVAAAGMLRASAPGNPLVWEGEGLAFGDGITALLSGHAGVLTVYGRSRTGIVHGTGADEGLILVSGEAGAEPGSVQLLSQPVGLDGGGVRALAVRDGGGLCPVTLSRRIGPWLDTRRGVPVACSLRVRGTGQYRVFWEDGTGLVMDTGGDAPAFMPLSLGRVLRCAVSGTGPDGRDWLLAGDDDGFVLRLDSGTSFDGARVPALLRLAFNHLGTPAQMKRFHKATLETHAGTRATLRFTADFGYGDPGLPPAAEQAVRVAGDGGFWNENAWDGFHWSAPMEGVAQAYIDGSGTNVSFAIAAGDDAADPADEPPHTLHGMTIHFSRRGMAQ